MSSAAARSGAEAELRPADWVLLAAAVLAGLVLRFWTSSHLWLDEALSVDIARLPLGDIVDALRHDGHPPLFYFLLHGWMAVFGEGDAAVRALSGLAAVAALPLAWRAGLRLGGRVPAWAAVITLSLSPYALRYATETRMYALVSLLALAGFLLVANALERPTPLRLGAITVVTAALLLSHYWALWLVAATVVVVGWTALRGADPHQAPARRVLLALAGGGVLFAPWVPVLLDQSAHTGTPWATVARPATIVVITLRDFGGGDYAEAVLLGWFLLGVALLGLFAAPLDGHRLVLDVRAQPRGRALGALAGGTMAIGAVASLLSGATYASRYAAVVLPAFVLLVALGVAVLPSVVARRIVIAVVVVLGLVGGVDNVRTDRTQAGDVAAVLRTEAAPGDVVVTCPDQLGPSLLRVAPPGLTVVAYPTGGDPALVDWRDYERRNATNDPAAFATQLLASAGEHAVWLVANPTYRTFEGQCEALEAALRTGRGGNEQVRVTMNPDRYFEPSSLFRFATAPQ